MQVYETTDLYLASFLFSSGIELLRIRHQGPKGVFVFAEAGKCEGLLLKFYNGRAQCDPREYARAVQELKAMVFSAGSNQSNGDEDDQFQLSRSCRKSQE